MRSPVSWALLGLVIQRPSYGYELVQRFERTYEDALDLSSPSQVYAALDALEGRCLIERMAVEEDDASRQPKPHYRATAEGVHDYRDWLVAQLHAERRRSRLFARQVAMLASADALVVIERCERACLREASDTRPAATDDAQIEGPTHSAHLVERLVGEEERLALGARLAWVEYARRQLTTAAAQPSPQPSPRR
ncbi:MAG TPA: PadR family transcriptional regulator [Solirubrobacteraceae bacterium]